METPLEVPFPPVSGEGEVEGMVEDNPPDPSVIMNLPDEILENIFARVSPYNDLDSLRAVCKRFYFVSKKVITTLKSNFEQSVIDGNLQCEALSAPVPEPIPPGQQRPRPSQGPSWINERFGHMCCYYDKAVYVVGGTTSTPTTFNDMWKFDLSTRAWSRCLAAGQYPTPKALASFVQYNDNLVLFGGWAHPPPYPLMQPWRIFDELHIYNFSTNNWSSIVTNNSPHPSAGHSASVHNDKMVVFGGRTFDRKEQSFPISNSAWIFDFLTNEWYPIITKDGPGPAARYGQTQISLDENKLLVVGGCGGPNQIFSDVWLLTFYEKGFGHYTGQWEKMTLTGDEGIVPNDFHYSGCKIGSNVCFFERSSPVSPFLAFLHFESTASIPQDQLTFEASRSRSYFHSRCTSGLRRQNSTTMPLYNMDISKVVTDKTVSWSKEPQPLKFARPNERLLYTMATGRAEIILFGGFFKERNRRECQVSSDVFILKTVHRSY